MGIQNIVFLLLLIVALAFFVKRILAIRRNILLGRDIDISDNASERWSTMARVAMGQSKMVVKPVAGFFHILIYVGFILINIEILEIVIDGIFGTHRAFAPLLGGLYDVAIGFFEILALGVLVACVVFLIRRNLINIPRFKSAEMKGWAKLDGNIILIVEIVLMGALLKMNACDQVLQSMGSEHYVQGGSFPISSWLVPFFESYSEATLIGMERTFWWFHIVGVLIFLNYVPYSKHFHILLAFPNTYYSKLTAKGTVDNLEAIKKEVAMMFDPNVDPYATPPEPAADVAPVRFGAKDVQDLSWKQLMDSYSCTECGRCTSECPANQTGKLLSPRKIMMDTRDRLEEVGKNLDKHGVEHDDGKSLLHNYISPEELWACTTCNACTEACPVNIDPLSIIVDLRRFLVMEESAAPAELNNMFSNVENNGAPWQFAQADRLNWADEA